MKNIILTILILSTCLSPSFSQKKKSKSNDRFHFIYDISFGIAPFKLTGLTTETTGYSIIDNHSVPIKPNYKITTTQGVAANNLIHLGLNIPFYRASNWSMGTRVYAGAGLQVGVTNADGLFSWVLDFPEYLYYSKSGPGLNFTVLAGYKITKAALNYNLPILGFELNINPKKNIRLYGSLQRYVYYSYYTDGRMEPFMKMGEYGIVYSVTL